MLARISGVLATISPASSRPSPYTTTILYSCVCAHRARAVQREAAMTRSSQFVRLHLRVSQSRECPPPMRATRICRYVHHSSLHHVIVPGGIHALPSMPRSSRAGSVACTASQPKLEHELCECLLRGAPVCTCACVAKPMAVPQPHTPDSVTASRVAAGAPAGSCGTGA